MKNLINAVLTTERSAFDKVMNNYAEAKIFNSDNFQYMELLSHLADTSDPFDFGENFTDDGEWIVDPDDIDENYDWNSRLETAGPRKKIGNDEAGYIEVPVLWDEYKSDDDKTGIVRYCDAAKKEAVTLAKLPCKDGKYFDVYYSVFKSCRTDSDFRITCTFRSVIEGKKCYRLDVFCKSTSTYISVWVTEGTDDHCYFLSVEYEDIRKSELSRTYSLPGK